MTEMLFRFLADCPHTPAITKEALGPGVGTGLFFRGVVGVAEDILGDKKPSWSYIVRHRGLAAENWAEAFCLWILDNPPAGWTVTPKRSGLCSPTKDGFSTWEVELTVTQQS